MLERTVRQVGEAWNCSVALYRVVWCRHKTVRERGLGTHRAGCWYNSYDLNDIGCCGQGCCGQGCCYDIRCYRQGCCNGLNDTGCCGQGYCHDIGCCGQGCCHDNRCYRQGCCHGHHDTACFIDDGAPTLFRSRLQIQRRCKPETSSSTYSFEKANTLSGITKYLTFEISCLKKNAQF